MSVIKIFTLRDGIVIRFNKTQKSKMIVAIPMITRIVFIIIKDCL